jgi:hypothetical protein
MVLVAVSPDLHTVSHYDLYKKYYLYKNKDPQDEVGGRPADFARRSRSRCLEWRASNGRADYRVVAATPLADTGCTEPVGLTVRSAVTQADASPELGSAFPGIVANPAFSTMSRCV